MFIRDKLFIGGVWVAPSAKQTIDVFNAGNGERLASRTGGGDRNSGHGGDCLSRGRW